VAEVSRYQEEVQFQLPEGHGEEDEAEKLLRRIFFETGYIEG